MQQQRLRNGKGSVRYVRDDTSQAMGVSRRLPTFRLHTSNRTSVLRYAASNAAFDAFEDSLVAEENSSLRSADSIALGELVAMTAVISKVSGYFNQGNGERGTGR